MIRWVAVIFVALLVFPVLIPELRRLYIGRLPGDVQFRLFGRLWTLPFGSTVVVSAVVFLAAKLLQ